MSLAIFENFLKFAEGAVAAKKDLPAAIDADDFESALVSYGVVLLHAQMEQCLRSAIETRCTRCVDSEVRAFALSVKDKETGKISIDALKGTLGRFGGGYKDSFKDLLNKSGLFDSGESSWKSVMNHRAIVAHEGQPAKCSLADLRLYYDEIRQVLGFFCHCLDLKSVDVATISPLIVMPAITASVPAAGL